MAENLTKLDDKELVRLASEDGLIGRLNKGFWLKDLNAELVCRLAELAELRKDKERLEWYFMKRSSMENIVTRPDYLRLDPPTDRSTCAWMHVKDWVNQDTMHDTFREAIDAAREKP